VLSAELREFALAPDRYTRVAPPVERFDDGTVCILEGPTWAAVSGVRTDDLAAALAAVRQRVAADKSPIWWIDDDARPADAYDRLLELGLQRPRDRADLVHALVCETEPATAPSDVRVTKVASFEEFSTATQIMWESFDTPADRREAQKAHLEDEYRQIAEHGVPITFVAWLDGRPAGVGRSVYSDRGVFLIAGSVLPEARGRGVYRALVRARWEDAVARGTPALVTEAVPDTSYPILKRLGFVDVGTTRRLEDRG
jgi:GNAT superfamily N-acetyltransferase